MTMTRIDRCTAADASTPPADPRADRPAGARTAGSPGWVRDADAPAADGVVDLGRRAGHAGVRRRARARHRHRPDAGGPGPVRHRSRRRAAGRGGRVRGEPAGRRGRARPRLGRVDLGGSQRPPTAAELDRAGGGRPVYLSQASHPLGAVSHGVAGRRAGGGGAPGYDASGWLRRDAHHVVRAVAHGLGRPGAAARPRSGRRCARAASLGIAAVHECGGPGTSGEDDFTGLLALAASARPARGVRVLGRAAGGGEGPGAGRGRGRR